MKTFLLRFLHSKPAHWAVCLLISFSYMKLFYTIDYPEATAIWLMPSLTALPAVLTFILVPGSYRKWYRWIVLGFLALTVEPPALMPIVLGIGTAWALYQSWFAERPLPIKQMFSLRKQPKKTTVVEAPVAPVVEGPKKPTTVAEVIAAEKAAAKGGKPEAKPKPAPVKVLTKQQKAAAMQAAKTATARAAAKVD